MHSLDWNISESKWLLNFTLIVRKTHRYRYFVVSAYNSPNFRLEEIGKKEQIISEFGSGGGSQSVNYGMGHNSFT